jgi:hypothetical protein
MQSLQMIPKYYISNLSYNSTHYLRFFLPKVDLQVGTTFNNITEAKLAIKSFVANAAKSWKVLLFDTTSSVRVYNRTYSWPLIPVSIYDLTPDESI